METVRVLVVEDNAADALWIKETLEDIGSIRLLVAYATTVAEAKESLEREKFDALVLDLGLPDSQGLETLIQLRTAAPTTPIVVLSELDDRTLAREAMRLGAQDYLPKDKCNGFILSRSINYVIERRRTEEALLREKSFSDIIVDVLPGIFYIFDEQGNLLRWNKNLERITRDSGREINSISPSDFFAPDDRTRVEEALQRGFSEGKTSLEAELTLSNGDRAHYLFTAKRIFLYDKPCLLGVGIDISTRVRAEAEARKTQERLDLALNGADLGLWISPQAGLW